MSPNRVRNAMAYIPHAFESIDGKSMECIHCHTAGTNPIHDVGVLADSGGDINTIILRRIEAKIDALTTAHAETVSHVETLVQKVEPHLAELGPMIDAIASNPMFKMLTGGKKRS